MLPGFHLTESETGNDGTVSHHDDSGSSGTSNKQTDTAETITDENINTNTNEVHSPKNEDSTPLRSNPNEKTSTRLLNDNIMSSDQLTAIHSMQKLRGLKRTHSNHVGSIGNANEQQKYNENLIKTLTPKKGHAKINEKITKIRCIWDEFRGQNPDYELHHAFNWNRAFWEFIYNYFHVLAFPLCIYREGMSGFWARQFLSPPGLIAWLALFIGNIAFFVAPDQLKFCFWYSVLIMNLMNVASKLVIATKYGYYPDNVFAEYSDSDSPVTRSYLDSLHLVPGWIAQHPLTMAREFWASEARLGIDLSKLKMTFRDTKAFDVTKGKNCACSQYYTTLDWLIPYIYILVNDWAELMSGPKFLIYLTLIQLLMFYTTIARLTNYSDSPLEIANCDTNCWVLVLSCPLALGWGVFTGWLWSASMAQDFNRRYYRMKLCTHLLDPKRETFQGKAMRQSYKGHLFGSVQNLKPKQLKSLDLQTIDLYSADTIFAWSQFRALLYDVGDMFLKREEAYGGLLLLCAVVTLLGFLYSLVDEDIIVVWEDFILTVLLLLFILAPSMWTLSCANSLNYQTMKQQKILSERTVEMLHSEYNTNYKHWIQHIVKGREMLEAAVEVLSQNEYVVTILGVAVDTSMVRLVSTIIGLCLYLTAWLVWKKWIVEKN